LLIEVTLWPNHPTWLAFLRLEDTLWPNHPTWLAFLRFEDTVGRTIRPGWHSCGLKTRLAEPSGALFFYAFARKKRPLRFALKHSFWLKLGLLNRRNAVEENIEWISDMVGGPTRTLP